MSRLTAALYERLTQAGEAANRRAWPPELLSGLDGSVFEVGACAGLNLSFYPKAVRRVVVSEPDAKMRALLRHRLVATHVDRFEVVGASLDDVPVPDESFDAVVSTLVLCSVRDLRQALAEIKRILKPGGRFFFLEHVAAEDGSSLLMWQRCVEPVWRRLAGNCHLTRRTEQAITRAGFVFEHIERAPVAKAMPLARPNIRGVARIPPRGAAPPRERQIQDISHDR